MKSRISLKDRGRREITSDDDFNPLAGFSRGDLIEARVREAKILERDIVLHIRQLGVTEVRVVIGDLEISPFIEVYGYRLTVDEASDLITRLDPKWKGYTCERSWDTLPTDDTLELYMGREEEHKKREEEKIQQQSDTETLTPEPESVFPQPVVRELELEKPKPVEHPPQRRRKLGGFPRRMNRG